jgi:dynein assembly factor with WDR repeat domains 1
LPLLHVVSCSELSSKLETKASGNYELYKKLQAHILPLTNVAFNKSGDRFITGSYDRTCKVWDTKTGTEILKLDGHKNVVYAIAFNNPFGSVSFFFSENNHGVGWNG